MEYPPVVWALDIRNHRKSQTSTFTGVPGIPLTKENIAKLDYVNALEEGSYLMYNYSDTSYSTVWTPP
ncbi:hypothetical protein LTR09_008489 [Extremus antarcticus]|uniref:Uncharacterized protein n=1 Tax=Extremus antarcticus TaxID=702011 RepID=A0AAJ0DHA8_9PEZI|nr:hypothetical protein LTR09_008489 [Extremus antarcticus]